jgi:hypothetical protein
MVSAADLITEDIKQRIYHGTAEDPGMWSSLKTSSDLLLAV